MKLNAIHAFLKALTLECSLTQLRLTEVKQFSKVTHYQSGDTAFKVLEDILNGRITSLFIFYEGQLPLMACE